jgi:hypothetical protein
MENFCLIVDHDPKWLTLAVPSVTPFKLRDKSDLDLENGPGDGLALDLDVKVWDVARELV